MRVAPPADRRRPRAAAAAAAVLATAALAASFMIGVNVIAPTYRARNASDANLARPVQPATADPSPDARPAPAPPAAPSRHERSSSTDVSATPVLTAAAMGTDLFSPSFVEQGHAILFHSGRTDSSLMRLSLEDAAKPSTILQDGAANFHAVRSPDGQRLAYDSDRDGTRAVYVARADGREATKVSGTGYAAVPRWSPDGGRLAFIKAEPAHPRVWNVWIADLGAHSLTRVSHHAVGQAWGASWFPGGTGLAYSVEDRLVIADLARGTRRVVPSPIRGRLVRTPAVSPDGKWIVFQVHHDGAWLLQTATGKMQRVLSDSTAEEFAWSPDSRRVVYHTHRGGGWSLWQLAFDRKTFIS
jgi:Tol biopolymer transport system component